MHGLVDALIDAGEELGFEVELVAPDQWEHGSSKGICKRRSPVTIHSVIEVRDRDDSADLPRALIHEIAHAILHSEPDEAEAKLDAEAEASPTSSLGTSASVQQTPGSTFDRYRSKKSVATDIIWTNGTTGRVTSPQIYQYSKIND